MSDAPSWDIPRLRHYADALVARRRATGAFEAPPPRGTRAAERLLERLARRRAADDPTPKRFATRTGDVPAGLKIAMSECQKPFHLWNVFRDVDDSKFAFVKGPRYVLGRAAAEAAPGAEGRPGKVVPASRVARAHGEETALLRADAFGARRRLRNVLRQDPAEEGLGLPD